MNEIIVIQYLLEIGDMTPCARRQRLAISHSLPGSNSVPLQFLRKCWHYDASIAMETMPVLRRQTPLQYHNCNEMLVQLYAVLHKPESYTVVTISFRCQSLLLSNQISESQSQPIYSSTPWKNCTSGVVGALCLLLLQMCYKCGKHSQKVGTFHLLVWQHKMTPQKIHSGNVCTSNVLIKSLLHNCKQLLPPYLFVR